MICKKCIPRSDCSKRSGLILVSTVCLNLSIGKLRIIMVLSQYISHTKWHSREKNQAGSPLKAQNRALDATRHFCDQTIIIFIVVKYCFLTKWDLQHGIGKQSNVARLMKAFLTFTETFLFSFHNYSLYSHRFQPVMCKKLQPFCLRIHVNKSKALSFPMLTPPCSKFKANYESRLAFFRVFNMLASKISCVLVSKMPGCINQQLS